MKRYLYFQIKNGSWIYCTTFYKQTLKLYMYVYLYVWVYMFVCIVYVYMYLRMETHLEKHLLARDY